MYSNGMSEVVLGKAIKELDLPRDEIVVLTKVYNPVAHDVGTNLIGKGPYDGIGYVNQHGLSRKVRPACNIRASWELTYESTAHLRVCEAQSRASSTRLCRCVAMSSVRQGDAH